jgi:hypothetical protein
MDMQPTAAAAAATSQPRRLGLYLALSLLTALAGGCATQPDQPYDYYGNPYAYTPYWSLYDDPFFWPYDPFADCYYCGGYGYFGYYGYSPWYYHPGYRWHHPGFFHPGPGWGRPPWVGPGHPYPRPGGGFHPPSRPMPRPHFAPHGRSR